MQNKSSLLIMALSFPLIALLIWTIALHMQIKDDQSVIIAVEGYDPALRQKWGQKQFSRL